MAVKKKAGVCCQRVDTESMCLSLVSPFSHQLYILKEEQGEKWEHDIYPQTMV